MPPPVTAAVVAVIGIFGLAWLGDSFIAAHKDVIVPAIGDWAGITVFFEFTPTTKHYYELFANLGFSTYLFNSLVAAAGSVSMLCSRRSCRASRRGLTRSR